MNTTINVSSLSWELILWIKSRKVGSKYDWDGRFTVGMPSMTDTANNKHIKTKCQQKSSSLHGLEFNQKTDLKHYPS